MLFSEMRNEDCRINAPILKKIYVLYFNFFFFINVLILYVEHCILRISLNKLKQYKYFVNILTVAFRVP